MKHFRINYQMNEFALNAGHNTGIDSYWSFIKRRIQKFTTLRGYRLPQHHKECQYMFNPTPNDLYKILFSLLRSHRGYDA